MRCFEFSNNYITWAIREKIQSRMPLLRGLGNFNALTSNIYQLIRGGQDLFQQLYPTTCWSHSSRGGAYPRNHRLAVFSRNFNSALRQSAKGSTNNPCVLLIQATVLPICHSSHAHRSMTFHLLLPPRPPSRVVGPEVPSLVNLIKRRISSTRRSSQYSS